MPHAVVATAYGAADVIEVVEIESREPGAGEVVLAVRAAALNPWDGKQFSGRMGDDPAKLPMRLGSEASGVVTAVGSDAVDLFGAPIAVGDELFGQRFAGAQASELTVKAANLLPKPLTLTHEQAAGLLSAGVTAVHALTVVALGEGETILIHGVSGSVGQMAAQLAKLRGATVIGTAAERRHADLVAQGIIPVAYGDGLLERVQAAAPQGVDAAFDTVGTDEALSSSVALVSDPHRIVTIVNYAATREAGGQTIGAGPGNDPGTEIRAAARAELTQLAADE